MRRALERLLSSEHSEENVLYYLDVEALVAFHNPDLRYVEVVRRTLEQLLEYGGLTREYAPMNLEGSTAGYHDDITVVHPEFA